jgi:hypothetical protein
MSIYSICLNWDEAEECWRFWLCPDNALFKQTSHRHLLLASSKENNENLLAIVPNITANFQSFENCEEKRPRSKSSGQRKMPSRSDFERAFQNTTLLQAKEKEGLGENPFRVLVHIEPDESNSQEFLQTLQWAKIALYKALHLYLLQDERYRSIDAHIALVYCAWQRYNLLKELIAQKEEQQVTRVLNYEFVMAYRALVELLEQETLSYAFHVLWVYGNQEKDKQSRPLSNSLVRERFQLSMVLSQSMGQSAPPFHESPLAAPLCFRRQRKWKQVQLHPYFTADHVKPSLRRLLRDWLLLRYDVRGAIWLAWRIPRPSWLSSLTCLLPLIPLVTALASVAMYSISASQIVDWGQQWWPLIVPFTVLFVGLLFFDPASLPNLALPRLWGGIAAGYLPFLFSQEVWWMVTLFCKKTVLFHILSPTTAAAYIYTTNWLPTLSLWSISLLVSFAYLWKEAYAYTADGPSAFCRALAVLVGALVINFLLGIWMIQLGVPIMQSADADPSRDGFQRMQFSPVLPCCHADFPIPFPVLLVFVPLALLIGIMVQIIWEEKPVTASVWLPEER